MGSARGDLLLEELHGSPQCGSEGRGVQSVPCVGEEGRLGSGWHQNLVRQGCHRFSVPKGVES